MEELKINKATVVSCFNNASEETKDALKHLFGEKVFEFDYTSIRTFEDACKKKGISNTGIQIHGVFDNKAYSQARALYQLMIIQDAINDGQPLDEDGDAWYPYWILYSKEEIAEMGEDKRKANGIRLLSCVSVVRRVREYVERLRFIVVRLRIRIMGFPCALEVRKRHCMPESSLRVCTCSIMA